MIMQSQRMSARIVPSNAPSILRGAMSGQQDARAIANAHLTPETTRQFDVALHVAATSSVESMTALRHAVCSCVRALKAGDAGAVETILAIKRCALDSATHHRPEFDGLPMSNVHTLIDQIVKWTIVEYYTRRS